MIRVVCTDIASADSQVCYELYQRASAERRRRADCYRRQEDKLRCVTADALLRRVLGTDQYQILRDENGKPSVKDRPELHYNLSHSGRYVVLAWGDGAVGVDVQHHGAAADPEAIGARFFAPGELAYIRQDADKMTDRFYEIWTRKESYLKYIGTGLRKDMRTFNTLEAGPEVRYFFRKLDEAHSLCLCTGAQEAVFELLDVRQLL